MALAISSLPVPLSPCSSTVERLGATCATRSKMRSIGLAFADDVLEVIALLQRALELDHLFFRAAAADSRAHVGQQLLVIPGLLDEVGRAGLHGVDGVLHRAVGRDHDDRQLGIALANVLQNLDAITLGQSEVQQNQIVGPLGDARQAFHAIVGDCRRSSLQTPAASVATRESRLHRQ